MIFILVSWLAIILATCGIGALAISGLSRLSSGPRSTQLTIFTFFWIGLATTIAFAQLWNVFLPLDYLGLIVWIAISLIGLIPFIKYWYQYEYKEIIVNDRQCGLLRLFIFACISCYLLLHSLAGVSVSAWSGAYDTDLYHFNSLRWMNEYAAIPGLGNLHSRLAHTSGFLVYSALLDNIWWDRATAWLTYGLIISLVAIQWIWTIFMSSFRSQKRIIIYCLLTLPYILQLQTNLHPTLYFDEIALIVQLVLALELLRMLFHDQKQSILYQDDIPINIESIAFLLVIATLGFSIKPVGALSLLLVSVFVVWVIFHLVRLQKWNVAQTVKAVALVSILPALLISGHVARNVILAGWIAYPAPIGQLDVDWAMPHAPAESHHWHEMQSVEGQYNVIKAWARLPGAEYHKALTEGISYWFPKWQERVWHGIERVWFVIGMIFVFAHLAGMKWYEKNRGQNWYDLFLLVLFSGNLLFWFLSAPEMRFGRAFFWILMALPLSMILSRSLIKPVVSWSVVSVLTLYSFNAIALDFSLTKPQSLWNIGKAPPRETRPFEIENGQQPPLIINYPTKSDQCGDSALPCTPYPLKSLLLREPGVIQSGFRSAYNQK